MELAWLYLEQRLYKMASGESQTSGGGAHNQKAKARPPMW